MPGSVTVIEDDNGVTVTFEGGGTMDLTYMSSRASTRGVQDGTPLGP
jgi:hypothetical protein